MSKHFVLDENHNLIEAYSAQEVLSVLEQAIANGSLANVVAGQAIVDKLKCCVGGATHHVAFIPQAKYNELKASGSLIADCLYFITDDKTADDIEILVRNCSEYVTDIMSGATAVPKSVHAENADNADDAKSVNGIQFQKNGNFCSVDGNMISMRKVVWCGEQTLSKSETTEININENPKGCTYEVYWRGSGEKGGSGGIVQCTPKFQFAGNAGNGEIYFTDNTINPYNSTDLERASGFSVFAVTPNKYLYFSFFDFMDRSPITILKIIRVIE